MTTLSLMPRPRSDDKRSAILEAATRIIVEHGLGGSTAAIAKEAGVANGTLFTYFETKTELFNQLYLELKGEMATAALEGALVRTDIQEQFSVVWNNWTQWATSFPEKRLALAQLTVSGEITLENRALGNKMLAELVAVVEVVRKGGPLKKAPLGFVFALMNSVAEATMDFMTQDTTHARQHCKAGFDAIWRMLT